MQTENLIAGEYSSEGNEIAKAYNPSTGEALTGDFYIATQIELETAAEAAENAFVFYKQSSGATRAKFLRKIAEEIENLGDTLISRVMLESGLPEKRVKGERGRTCGQLRLFADFVEEGTWVDATIDEAMPDRKPMPRTDIRRMLQPIGPIAIFTASNFPLAFSTAGGDTASAFASGCPVIVKAHPSHLGTNALVSEAIDKAAKACSLPDGIYSSLQDNDITIGQALVQHPSIKAVAFTGSFRGGYALYKAATERAEPIPVFSEMGSVNPIFILPEEMKTRGEELAKEIAFSVNMGAGQFCTNPGLIIIQDPENQAIFKEQLRQTFEELPSFTMLNKGIAQNFEDKKQEVMASEVVNLEYQMGDDTNSMCKALPTMASMTGDEFISDSLFQEEVFGPFTLVVNCKDADQMDAVASSLKGQLTGTIMGSEEEITRYTSLYQTLQEKVGRIIFNGVPTGVEVTMAMHHGGPFPATTDSRFTSVGTNAIHRFVRPICYQNIPDSLLPDSLKNENPLSIWRTINGKKTKE